MAMTAEEFYASVEDWESRISQRENIIDTFESLIPNDKTFENVLIIGPGNCQLEKLLLASPKCESTRKIILVDSSKEALEKSVDIINKCGRNEKKIITHNVPMEHYKHEGEGLDLIVLSHVVYYFIPHFPTLMKRFTSWLNEGGLVFVTSAYSEFELQLMPYIDKTDGYGAVDPTFLVETAHAANFHYKLKYSSHLMNVAEDKDGNNKWMWLYVNAKPTQEQIDIMKGYRGNATELSLLQIVFVAWPKDQE